MTPSRPPPAPPHLVLGEFGGVLQQHLLLLGRGVARGQGQAAQGVPPRPPLLDDRQDLLLHRRRQRDARRPNPHVIAAVDDALGGTLGWGSMGSVGPTGVNGTHWGQ